MELDPDSWEVNKEAGRLALHDRRIEDAARHYRKAAEVMDNDFHTWGMLVTCLHALGDTEGIKECAEHMVSEAQKALAEDPGNGSALGIAAGGMAILGDFQRARETIDRAMLLDPDNDNMRYNFACVLATRMEDFTAALSLLSTTLLRSRVHFVHAQTDTDFDGLREDPRFIDLMKRAGSRFGIAGKAD